MAKTQIKQDGHKVTISYDDAFMRERVTRSFFTRGAYVYEYDENGRHTQVCDRLETRGSTLHSPSDDAKLIDLIRSEYKAMRSAEKREKAAIGF